MPAQFTPYTAPAQFTPCTAPANMENPATFNMEMPAAFNMEIPEYQTMALEEDVCFRVGRPAVRIEPTWREEQWWLVAPVDFKGLEKRDFYHMGILDMVDGTLEGMDMQNMLPPLPPPVHWKDGESCRIA